MNGKILYFVLLALALILGCFVGRVLAKRAMSKLIYLVIYLVGAFGFLVGEILAEQDRRFRTVAIAGLFLETVAIVSSFGRRRTATRRSVDLWAERKKG